jgi:pyrroloquinoline quinone biosynthesis protein B
MVIKILGSAAGGGFPQWNCNCRNCSRFRQGRVRSSARTQTQIAFSPDNQTWFLVGASPDLRSQILCSRALSPRAGDTSSPIAGIFLPSAEVDAVMGLLHLREFQRFVVYATAAVQDMLKAENRIFQVLSRGNPPVEWRTLSSKGRVGCYFSDDPGASFVCDTIPLSNSFPDYVGFKFRGVEGTNEASVGFLFGIAGKSFLVAPSLSNVDGFRHTAALSADLMLIDGTFWSDDELRRTGRSNKTAREMGHLPLSGPGGLLARFPRDVPGRRILIHINNTNPILDEDSEEHRVVRDAGFEIAYDGLEIRL